MHTTHNTCQHNAQAGEPFVTPPFNMAIRHPLSHPTHVTPAPPASSKQRACCEHPVRLHTTEGCAAQQVGSCVVECVSTPPVQHTLRLQCPVGLTLAPVPECECRQTCTTSSRCSMVQRCAGGTCRCVCAVLFTKLHHAALCESRVRKGCGQAGSRRSSRVSRSDLKK